MNILLYIVSFLAFFVALTIHEFCHGFSALLLGDTTARDEGRLTFNPLAHIDWFGTVILPLILILTQSGIVVGWAKPVPVNYYNLKYGKWGVALVSLAGPVANFVGGIAALVILKLVMVYAGLGQDNLLVIFLISLVLINFVLMIFNLIPIPPLDGSKILFAFLPARWQNVQMFLERYGIVILIIFLAFGGGILDLAFNAIFVFLDKML